MPYTATVLYPNEDDAKFDMDYYLSTHMPLVAEKWGQYGLKSWQVVKFEGGLNGAKGDFSVQAVLVWDSKESMDKATTSQEAQAVFGDVPNFSNKGPVFVGGPVLGEATV